MYMLASSLPHNERIVTDMQAKFMEWIDQPYPVVNETLPADIGKY